MFVQNATELIQGTFTGELWKVKNKSWLAKQEYASVVIINCHVYQSCEAVRNFSTFAKIIVKVETGFQLSKSAVFTALDRKYNKFSFSDGNKVKEFAKKLCKGKKKPFKLDFSSKIGKPHFIYKCSSIFGHNFDIFCAAFSQTYLLLTNKSAGEIIDTAAVLLTRQSWKSNKKSNRSKNINPKWPNLT